MSNKENNYEFFPLDKEVSKKDLENFHFPNQKLGVIIHIEDAMGNILLQQRGMKSRDEQGLFEDIGGKVENSDISFIDAIKRELQEEAGLDVEVIIHPSIGIYHCFKHNTNWIFIIYFGNYIKGKFEIKEKDKCLGYSFFSYEESQTSPLVSESCKYLIKEIKKTNFR